MRKRILFINHSSDLTGGANDDFIRMLKYFSNFKDKYHISGLFPEGPNADIYSIYCDESFKYSTGFFPVTGEYLSHYYGYLKIFFIQRNEINNILKDKTFDLCIFNVVVMFWIMRLVKKRKIKSIIFIREMIQPSFIRKIFYHFVSKYGDFFVFVSNSLEKDFIEITGFNNVKTLYSSIEKNLKYESRVNVIQKEILSSEFKEIILSNIQKFITVGAVNDRKNQFMILESAKLLKEILKDDMPYFVFIGPEFDKPYVDKLKKFIQREKLNHKCFLMGQRDKEFIYNIFSLMSGMIISSKSEGLPLVLVEALRFKLPLITTNAGGIPDIIKNGYNGLIINDKNSLVNAVMKLINDEKLRNEIKDNGYKTYIEKFNLEENMKEISNIIEKLVYGK